ncbi:MAG: type II toxin-antitoxin system RelE/ParE family toxin [Pyrinomonadaceae bacterium]|jgi:toxin ParE1/3/4|nr:type II toxin-antitoxin system RelE/ParE family toxin [Pyrinomonadaceae bacterium]
MIKYTAHAESDLDEIFDFLLNEGQNYAKKVLKEIAGKLTLLERNIHLGKPQDSILLNLRSFPAKKYIIYYTPIEEGIEVFRIIHSSRDVDGIFDDFFGDLESLENQ